MDEQNRSFGYWLRRRRKALDLTQGALAEKVSCSPAAIKKIEAEERRPSRALAQRLAEQLAIPAEQRTAFLEAARRLGSSARIPIDDQPLTPAGKPAVGDAREAAPEPQSAFVGRDEEYGQFIGLVAGLTAGHGHVVFIQGEAGIGKSRLMHEVLDYVRQRGLPAFSTNCYEIERSMAYQCVIDLATQACEAVAEQRLRAITPVLLAEIAAVVPALAARVPGLPPLSPEFPEARQTRLFHALEQLFDALARDRQLVLGVDNIQWGDDSSLRWLHFLARRIVRRPVLLICTHRDGEGDSNEQLAALLEGLRPEAHTRHMALSRLAPAETQALLQRMNDPRLGAPEVAARLHRESDGNPFFLWSILHSISEHDGVVAREGSLPMPDAVRDSVRARLARVPHEDRPLLDIAAVLGRRFDFETLLALTQLPEQRFLRALDTLVRRRLLREEQGGFHDFSHDKVREVVYGDIGVARRVLLHRLVAQWMEEHGDGESDAHLAEHFERARMWNKALHYLGLAADHSQKLFAMREALQWFDRAVGLAREHPEAATQREQLALHERRGAARVLAGHTQGAVADFQWVIDTARTLGQHACAREALIQLGMAYRRADAYEPALACLNEALGASRAIGDERRVADTLYHLGTVAWSNGRNDLAIAHHQEAVDICERMGLRDLTAVQAFHGRGEAHFANAQPAFAIASFSRSLALARGIDDRSYESENLMMIGWACTGHMGLADYTRALSHFDSALEIARSADLQWHLGPTLIGRAYTRAAAGSYGDAWADLSETLPRLETLRLVRYRMMAHDAMGCVLIDLDLHEAAARHFSRGLSQAQGAGLRYWVPRLQAGLAIAQLRGGQACDAGGLLAALLYCRQHSENWLASRCLEALAEHTLAVNDARACLERAGELLALAEGGQMRELVARAHWWRGMARAAMGNQEPAHAELAKALQLAERIGQVRLQLDCHLSLAKAAAARGASGDASAHRSSAGALKERISLSLQASSLVAAWNLDR